MSAKLLSRAMVGLGYGGLYIFAYITILYFWKIDATVSDLWFATLASLLIGIYFGISSLIFEIESWSMLKRTVVHFLLSLAVFYPIAIGTGWLPFTTIAILVSFGIFVVIYAFFWVGMWLYFKRQMDLMNRSIK